GGIIGARNWRRVLELSAAVIVIFRFDQHETGVGYGRRIGCIEVTESIEEPVIGCAHAGGIEHNDFAMVNGVARKTAGIAHEEIGVMSANDWISNLGQDQLRGGHLRVVKEQG